MAAERGAYRSLSPGRKWMGDLVALSRTIPIAALEHRIHIQPVIEARQASPHPRPSWVALFLKAFALVARKHPHLRQGYFGLPWPRLYEHPFNVAAITVEREYAGIPTTFFEMLPQPESMGVMELHGHLKRLKTAPVESIPAFRRLILGNLLPLPLRRLGWRWLHSLSGPRRAYYCGTFAVNGGTRFPIRPVTTTGCIGLTLYFGMFHDDGTTDVCLTFDHRVLDGGEIVRAMDELESILNTDIVLELNALPRLPQTPSLT